MSGIPNVRLDHRMAGDLRSRDSVPAVADVKDVTGPDQPHRRRLTALLEPHSVELDLRPVEVTGAEADVRQRNPCRCERRICDTPPFSRSSRVRTGGVEPPQPGATRLQRAELAGARRPRGCKALRRRSRRLQGSAPPEAEITRAGFASAEPASRKDQGGRSDSNRHCGDHDPGCSPLHHGRQATWGNPWFPHEPPPSCSCTGHSSWASRAAKPPSGRVRRRIGHCENPRESERSVT